MKAVAPARRVNSFQPDKRLNFPDPGLACTAEIKPNAVSGASGYEVKGTASAAGVAGRESVRLGACCTQEAG